MIPHTFPSELLKVPELDEDLNEIDASFVTVYKVNTLLDVDGLKRWVDYSPVQVVTADNLNSYGNSDALLVVEDAEGIPVFEEGTVAWSANEDGYIPIEFVGN